MPDDTDGSVILSTCFFLARVIVVARGPGVVGVRIVVPTIVTRLILPANASAAATAAAAAGVGTIIRIRTVRIISRVVALRAVVVVMRSVLILTVPTTIVPTARIVSVPIAPLAVIMTIAIVICIVVTPLAIVIAIPAAAIALVPVPVTTTITTTVPITIALIISRTTTAVTMTAIAITVAAIALAVSGINTFTAIFFVHFSIRREVLTTAVTFEINLGMRAVFTMDVLFGLGTNTSDDLHATRMKGAAAQLLSE